MNVRANFNNKNYELIYNQQTGFYETEIQAPKEKGGVYNVDITITDILGDIKEDNVKVQVLAKEDSTSISEETLVYFLDKTNLEIKDVIEFEDYTYVIDEETNKSTIFEVMGDVNAKNKDIVILQRNGESDYIGVLQKIENIDGEEKREATLKYISNIFDRKIILGNENTIKEKGIEDFIAQEIKDNFTNSDDDLLNIKWLDVEVLTHTPEQASASTISTNIQNNIYNFHTFITNCTQNYDIVLDYKYENGRIKLKIYKQEQEAELVDTTVEDISDYVECFETSIISKVTVKTDTDIQSWYLLSDRTTTQDKENKNRAYGEVEVIYTAKTEDAEQAAYNKFKANSYNHYISFTIYRKSKLFNVSNFKVGTKLNVRTDNNIILNTYISAISDNGDEFISITCGNMRISNLDQNLQERNKEK